MTVTNLKRGAHLTGEAREAAARQAAESYAAGQTIRSIAVKIGRSYGCTRSLLIEAGVQMRSRRARASKGVV